MKKFTQTTLIALLIGTFVFAQKGSPGNQAAPSQTTVIVGALRGSVILLSPADGKSIAASDASKPVLFRWTAVSPKPKEAVTYRLKVWQLMQGQNGTEAMRSNQPIIAKDVVNITQATIGNIYTGPCKPPYLCDFVWAVEVLNSESGFVSNSNAGSNAYSFKFENISATKAEANNKGNSGNTGLATGKSIGANGDSGYKYKTYQPGKPVYGNATLPPASGESIDKELDKGPFSVGKNDCCLNPCCSENAIWIDLPIEKMAYDNNGNITGVVLKTEKGESAFVKVVVAGSNSISGGIMQKTEKRKSVVAKVVVAGINSISGGGK